MSYDIHMVDKNGKALDLPEKHHFKGSTYVLGGTTQVCHNITYKYGKFYREVFGEKGIRILYGKTGKKCLPILNKAIKELGVNKSTYWEVTRGNAGHALLALVFFCEQFPDGIFEGD